MAQMRSHASRSPVRVAFPCLAVAALLAGLACGLGEEEDDPPVWGPSPEDPSSSGYSGLGTGLGGETGGDGFGSGLDPGDSGDGSSSGSYYGGGSSRSQNGGSSPSERDEYRGTYRPSNSGSNQTASTSSAGYPYPYLYSDPSDGSGTGSSGGTSSTDDGSSTSTSNSYIVKFHGHVLSASGIIICEVFDLKNAPLVGVLASKMLGLLKFIPFARLFTIAAGAIALSDVANVISRDNSVSCDLWAAARLGTRRSTSTNMSERREELQNVKQNPLLFDNLARSELVGQTIEIEIYDHDDYDFTSSNGDSILTSNIALGRCVATITEADIENPGQPKEIPCTFEGDSNRLSTTERSLSEQLADALAKIVAKLDNKTATVSLVFR